MQKQVRRERLERWLAVLFLCLVVATFVFRLIGASRTATPPVPRTVIVQAPAAVPGR